MFYVNVGDYEFELFILQMDQKYVTWILPPFNDDYIYLRNSDKKEYYAGLRRECSYRLNEAECLVIN